MVMEELRKLFFLLVLIINLLTLLVLGYFLFTVSRTTLVVWAGLSTFFLLYGLPLAFWLGMLYREREVQARLKGIEEGLSVKKGGSRPTFVPLLPGILFGPSSSIQLSPPSGGEDVIEV